METSLLGRPTFGGLASGFDTNALLEGLLALERQPLQRIQSRRAEINTQRSLMRDFNGKLVKLREAAQALDNRNTAGTGSSTDEEFLRYAGSTTNEDVVTVSAGRGAAPGDIEVTVDQLARGSRIVSTSYAEEDAPILAEGQTITIDLPNGDPDAVPEIEATSITVTAGAGGLSLQDIRDQINTSEGNGGTVRADVLRISEDDFRLVLTSTGTGTSNQITLGGDLVRDDALSQDASNASFRVFGQTLERESNFVDDALTGITLRLRQASELPEGFDASAATDEEIRAARIPETVSVEVDVEEVGKQLQTFVDAYNGVIDFIEGQFRFNEASNTSGPLSGDFTLRDVQRQLQELVSEGYAFTQNPSNPFANTATGSSEGGTISGIGLELKGGGRLSLDLEKLEESLALDPISVREFLSGRLGPDPTEPDEEAEFEQGFASHVASRLEEIVRSADGTLANRDEAYASRLREFDDSIERFEQRLAKREESLVLRFSQLESTIASLQSQQGFLSSLG